MCHENDYATLTITFYTPQYETEEGLWHRWGQQMLSAGGRQWLAAGSNRCRHCTGIHVLHQFPNLLSGIKTINSQSLPVELLLNPVKRNCDLQSPNNSLRIPIPLQKWPRMVPAMYESRSRSRSIMTPPVHCELLGNLGINCYSSQGQDHLDNTIRTTSVQQFKSLVVDAQCQSATMHSPYSAPLSQTTGYQAAYSSRSR